MAKAPADASSRNTPAVDQWLQTSKDLVGEAVTYAGSEANDPAFNSMIRQIMVMSTTLLTALQQTMSVVSQRPPQ